MKRLLCGFLIVVGSIHALQAETVELNATADAGANVDSEFIVVTTDGIRDSGPPDAMAVSLGTKLYDFDVTVPLAAETIKAFDVTVSPPAKTITFFEVIGIADASEVPLDDQEAAKALTTFPWPLADETHAMDAVKIAGANTLVSGQTPLIKWPENQNAQSYFQVSASIEAAAAFLNEPATAPSRQASVKEQLGLQLRAQANRSLIWYQGDPENPLACGACNILGPNDLLPVLAMPDFEKYQIVGGNELRPVWGVGLQTGGNDGLSKAFFDKCVAQPWHADCLAGWTKVAMRPKPDLLDFVIPRDIPENYARLLADVQTNVVFMTMEGLAIAKVGDRHVIKAVEQNQCLLPENARTDLSIKHCSGILSRDGMSVYTAAHCVRELMTKRLSMSGSNRVDEIMRNLQVGVDVACDPASEFRFVLGGAALEFVDDVSDASVRSCQSVERISKDVVKIALRDGVQRETVPAAEIIFPDDKPVDGTKPTRHRRVAALGFGHRNVLSSSSGGYIAENAFCLDTFARNDIEGVIETDIGAESYLCVSTDTISGMSGGPAFSLLDDGRWEWIGVISRAIDAGVNLECANWFKSTISDKPADQSRQFNLVAAIP